MTAQRSVALVLALAGAGLLLAFWADHARNIGFTPVNLTPCEGLACIGTDPVVLERYEAALDGGLSPWNDVDFCAAAIEILRGAPKEDRARWIPGSLEARGVLQISEAEGSLRVAPGPALSSAVRLLWSNLRPGGARSCMMSNYGALGWAWLFAILAAILLAGVRRPRRG